MNEIKVARSPRHGDGWYQVSNRETDEVLGYVFKKVTTYNLHPRPITVTSWKISGRGHTYTRRSEAVEALVARPGDDRFGDTAGLRSGDRVVITIGDVSTGATYRSGVSNRNHCVVLDGTGQLVTVKSHMISRPKDPEKGS